MQFGTKALWRMWQWDGITSSSSKSPSIHPSTFGGGVVPKGAHLPWVKSGNADAERERKGDVLALTSKVLSTPNVKSDPTRLKTHLDEGDRQEDRENNTWQVRIRFCASFLFMVVGLLSIPRGLISRLAAAGFSDRTPSTRQTVVLFAKLPALVHPSLVMGTGKCHPFALGLPEGQQLLVLNFGHESTRRVSLWLAQTDKPKKAVSVSSSKLCTLARLDESHNTICILPSGISNVCWVCCVSAPNRKTTHGANHLRNVRP